MHVHVNHRRWRSQVLVVSGVDAGNKHWAFTPTNQREAQSLVAIHLEEITHAWQTHSPG